MSECVDHKRAFEARTNISTRLSKSRGHLCGVLELKKKSFQQHMFGFEENNTISGKANLHLENQVFYTNNLKRCH